MPVNEKPEKRARGELERIAETAALLVDMLDDMSSLASGRLHEEMQLALQSVLDAIVTLTDVVNATGITASKVHVSRAAEGRLLLEPIRGLGVTMRRESGLPRFDPGRRAVGRPRSVGPG